MIQKQFAKQIIEKIQGNSDVIGLAAGGSWITNEMDDYSDLDLVLVTKTKFTDDKIKMMDFAAGLGQLLNAFTGEHVGEPRVLICMYDNPFLHVDIKFVTIEEFKTRVEDPAILWEKDGVLSQIIQSTKSAWPELDFQWIEDRFWTWIHYATLKIGRGEYFEALEFLSFLRVVVIAPLMQLKNQQLPRGLRKVEFRFSQTDLDALKSTIPTYTINSIVYSLERIMEIYQALSSDLFPDSIKVNDALMAKTKEFLFETKKKLKLKVDLE